MGIIDLANEYAQITGRPLATLSVSEFIELKKFGTCIGNDRTKADTDIPITPQKRVLETKIKEPDLAEIPPYKDFPHIQLLPGVEEVKREEIDNIFETKESGKQPVQKHNKDAFDENAIIKMMQSISG